MIAYLVGVIGTAVICGLVLNELYNIFEWPLQLSIGDREGFPVWRELLGVILICLIARVWIQPILAAKKTLTNSVEQV